MRFANHAGRLTLVLGPQADDLEGAPAIDINHASQGRLPSDPERAFELWDDVLKVAAGLSSPPDLRIRKHQLGSPSPRPRQIFGVGINYADHGQEAGMQVPETPLIFTKLTTAVTGPFAAIALPSETVDWEAEIAVVIGRPAYQVQPADAWRYVAGITAGQDLSDRALQWRPASNPQFCLGKSLAGFAPLGPTLVTLDSYANPDDIELGCRLNGEQVQRSTSRYMLRSVPEIISYLSGIINLWPGDVIFTGTPAGIGMTRTPPRYLQPGDTLETFVAGVGAMSHTFVRHERRSGRMGHSPAASAAQRSFPS